MNFTMIKSIFSTYVIFYYQFFLMIMLFHYFFLCITIMYFLCNYKERNFSRVQKIIIGLNKFCCRFELFKKINYCHLLFPL